MDNEDSKRLLELLTTRQSELVAQWEQTVGASLRGRVSTAELGRELGELYEAITEAVSQGGLSGRGDRFAVVRSLLVELSRTRARQGSPRPRPP